MKSVGFILKEAREAKKVSLRDVSSATRIKERFLCAIEEMEWGSLPNLTVTQGFVKNFAQVVGVDSGRAAALLRRDFPVQTSYGFFGKVGFPIVHRGLWTPKTTVFAGALLLVFLLGGYLLRQYLQFARAPGVEIGQLTRENGEISVAGKTSPNAELQVDGRAVLVEEDGRFEVKLDETYVGSVLEIRARSRTGRETVVQRNVD